MKSTQTGDKQTTIALIYMYRFKKQKQNLSATLIKEVRASIISWCHIKKLMKLSSCFSSTKKVCIVQA